MTTSRRAFLRGKVEHLLAKLTADTRPAFGLMTSQHMIEHLVLIVKTSVKRYGEPEGEPTKGQLNFKRFLAQGAVFEHRPRGKTKADLPQLKYDSLEEAIAQVPVAIDRFYSHFDANPGFKAFSPIMGELGFADLELFHYQHFRYHFWQFGLLQSYP